MAPNLEYTMFEFSGSVNEYVTWGRELDFLTLGYLHLQINIPITTGNSNSAPEPPPVMYIQDVCLSGLICLTLVICAFNWTTGMDGAGDSFLKFSISTGVMFDTLNASQILKLEGENFGIAKFAVLSAAGKPLEYCSNYGGNLIFGENALQAGCSSVIVNGGWSVLIWVSWVHLISIVVTVSTDIAQIPLSK